MYQKSIFEYFKTKIFLDDSWILLMIPDRKSSPLCGHVTMKWLRRRKDFCLSQQLPEMTSNLHEILFLISKKEILLGDCCILPMIADHNQKAYINVYWTVFVKLKRAEKYK